MQLVTVTDWIPGFCSASNKLRTTEGAERPAGHVKAWQTMLLFFALPANDSMHISMYNHHTFCLRPGSPEESIC
jgi:hypothetical protein